MSFDFSTYARVSVHTGRRGWPVSRVNRRSPGASLFSYRSRFIYHDATVVEPEGRSGSYSHLDGPRGIALPRQNCTHTRALILGDMYFGKKDPDYTRDKGRHQYLDVRVIHIYLYMYFLVRKTIYYRVGRRLRTKLGATTFSRG